MFSTDFRLRSALSGWVCPNYTSTLERNSRTQHLSSLQNPSWLIIAGNWIMLPLAKSSQYVGNYKDPIGESHGIPNKTNHWWCSWISAELGTAAWHQGQKLLQQPRPRLSLGLSPWAQQIPISIHSAIRQCKCTALVVPCPMERRSFHTVSLYHLSILRTIKSRQPRCKGQKLSTTDNHCCWW